MNGRLVLPYATTVLLNLALSGALRAAEATPNPAPPGGSRATLLSEKHFWRKQYTFFPPSLSVKSAEAAGLPVDAESRAKYFAKTHDLALRTAPPAAEWKSPDFADGDWLLRRGREFTTGDGRIRGATTDETNVHLRGGDPFMEQVGLISYRGSFLVKNRAKVGRVRLTLTYRGGFVAYLNGKEVARGHLPDGVVQPTTPAGDYPLEAWFYAEDGDKRQKKGHYLNAFDDKAPWGLRERTFGPKDIAADALRDGTNVLAIEIHRSDYPAEVAKTKYEAGWQRGWATVGMSLLTFEAEAPDGMVLDPGPRVPNGLRAWAVDITRQVSTRAAPNIDEGSAPIRIVAARNGTFAGMVAAGSDKPLEGLSAKVSDLKQAGGKGSIPAGAMQVRYAAGNGFWPSHMGYYGPIGLSYLDGVVPVDLKAKSQADFGHRLDVLLEAPPRPAVSSLGIWLTVRVPKDVPAGLYKGSLSVAAQGAQPVAVPVELSVADWTLPDVKDYGGLLMIYQSPETLAAFYKVKPWSEEHWRLIERSLRLMGEGGNVGFQFQVLSKSCMGNEDSWIIWEKKADGTYEYDFGIFDRYLKTAMKYHDPARVRIVVLNVWGLEAGKTYAGNPEKYPQHVTKSGGVCVTVRDPATGRKEDLLLPPYGSEECEKLLRPVVLGARKRLETFGLAERIMWGKGSDDYPLPGHVAMLERILPGTPWYRESHWDCHSFRLDLNDKSKVVPVGASSIVWGGAIPVPSRKRLYGWRYNAKHIVFNFNRFGVSCLCLLGFPPPWSYHMWMESTLACGRNGNGNVGGDYWPIVNELGKVGALPAGGAPGNWNGGGTFCGLYPASNMGRNGVGNNTVDLFGPGPDGPVSTIRYENAREGNQEAEARIFIEKALLDKDKPLPAALAAECQAMLDERTSVLRYWALGAAAMAPYQWQERNRRLFDCAARVAEVSGR